MNKRRINGEGNVRRRKNGCWEGRIVIGHKKDGTPIFQFSYATSQRELIDSLRQDIDAYADVDLKEDCTMPLKEWLRRWLKEYASINVRDSTLNSYQNMLERHVIPMIGDVPVKEVSKTMVQNMYREIRERGRIKEDSTMGYRLSNTTIRKIHNVLHQAMDDAIKERLIALNPTENIRLPKREVVPKTILNDEQLERFLLAIKKDQDWYDFFYTEITTGLRRGEICGLMWSDFNAKSGELTVRRTIHNRPGGGLEAGETKTKAGLRTIKLPSSTAQLLVERKKKSYSCWIFYDLLMPERPINPCTVYRKLKEILSAEDLPPMRFHDLRHTFATHAISSGVDPKTLSSYLGHTKASFTLDTYTHTTGDMQRNASIMIGDFLKKIVVGEPSDHEEET